MIIPDLMTTNNYHDIVLKRLPLIDVRAPIEFSKGSFLNSVNLPLMNDEERHNVGIRYKEEGNEEAIKLGEYLVSGSIKDLRVQNWIDFYQQNPECYIYCFRGGQRSRITQGWIYDQTGIEIPRLEGGYKAFRNYLMNYLDNEACSQSYIRIGGYTGSGKTPFIRQFPNMIDLESLANHRGSSFGHYVDSQPNQINFENKLAYDLVSQESFDYTIIEDEGNHIGKCYIPKRLATCMADSSLVIMNVSMDQRIDHILTEYVIDFQKNFQTSVNDFAGIELWLQFMNRNLLRIQKKLGGTRYNQIKLLLDHATLHQLNSGELSLHRDWIASLLTEYYDPMYAYQIENNKDKIVYQGNEIEIKDFLSNLPKNF